MSGQVLSQRQGQVMRLSPQQILYTKLLQLPMVQFEERIKQELENNPLLEEASEMEETLEQPEPQPDIMLNQPEVRETDGLQSAQSGSTDSADQENNKPKEPEVVVEPPKEEQGDKEIEEFVPEVDEGYKVPTYREPSDEDHFFQVVYHESLSDNLLNQLSIQGLSETQSMIASEIIGNLDSDGYLRCPLDVIQDGLLTVNLEVSEQDILDVLKDIWYLEPPGIGARSLQECLLIQLEVKIAFDDSEDEHAELALQILKDHFDAFKMMHYDKIINALKISPEQLKLAVETIQKLNPKPGGVGFDSGNYITPDFVVIFENNELVAIANDRSSFQIKISSRYKDLLEDKQQPKKAREFVRQKLESARQFMSAIEMRRHTLHNVMNAILKLQYDFFTLGPDKLKPMILKDVADMAGVDISTVSRVVNGKYVQDRHGVWELKHFFSTAMETQSGEEISNRLIKQEIKQFIDQEESGKPLSDDKISKMLEEKGFKVARRTVTKYREQLNIPVARLRKKI
jgi:RNA polymerase sigma-54 factor